MDTGVAADAVQAKASQQQGQEQQAEPLQTRDGRGLAREQDQFEPGAAHPQHGIGGGTTRVSSGKSDPHARGEIP